MIETVPSVQDQFPFSAVVGMDDMRLALILNAISPAIGGVLIRGEKGTAKSTAVRALTAILPPVEVSPVAVSRAPPPRQTPSAPTARTRRPLRPNCGRAGWSNFRSERQTTG